MNIIIIENENYLAEYFLHKQNYTVSTFADPLGYRVSDGCEVLLVNHEAAEKLSDNELVKLAEPLKLIILMSDTRVLQSVERLLEANIIVASRTTSPNKVEDMITQFINAKPDRRVIKNIEPISNQRSDKDKLYDGLKVDMLAHAKERIANIRS